MGIAPIMGPPTREPAADPAEPGEATGEPEPAVSPVPALGPMPRRGAPPAAPGPPDVPAPLEAFPPVENGRPERAEPPPAVALSGLALAEVPLPTTPAPVELEPFGIPRAPIGAEEEVPDTVLAPGEELESRPTVVLVPLAAGVGAAAPDRLGLVAVALTGRVAPPVAAPTPAGMTPDAACPDAADVPTTGEPAEDAEPPPPAGADALAPPGELDAAWVAASTPVRDSPPTPPLGPTISWFQSATGDMPSVPTPPTLPTRCAGVKVSPERFAPSRRGL